MSVGTRVGTGAAYFHRMLFVLGTVGVAVMGSRVAATPADITAWILAAGAVTLLVLSDIGREIDQLAVRLAETSGLPIAKARVDVAEVRTSCRIAIFAILPIVAASWAILREAF